MWEMPRDAHFFFFGTNLFFDVFVHFWCHWRWMRVEKKIMDIYRRFHEFVWMRVCRRVKFSVECVYVCAYSRHFFPFYFDDETWAWTNGEKKKHTAKQFQYVCKPKLIDILYFLDVVDLLCAFFLSLSFTRFLSCARSLFWLANRLFLWLFVARWFALHLYIFNGFSLSLSIETPQIIRNKTITKRKAKTIFKQQPNEISKLNNRLFRVFQRSCRTEKCFSNSNIIMRKRRRKNVSI